MANGVAAALPLLAPETPADSPGAAPISAVERQIGDAAAAAAVAIAYAITGFAVDGRLTDAGREVGGERLGQLAQLRLDTLDPAAFAATALAEGRRVLLQRHGVVLRQHFGAAGVEQAISELVGWAVTIAEKVARDELALQRA